MPILTRRDGGSLMIKDDVPIKVPGVKSTQVCIGIQAPKSAPVHREEIYDRLKLARSRSAQGGHEPMSTPSFAICGAPE